MERTETLERRLAILEGIVGFLEDGDDEPQPPSENEGTDPFVRLTQHFSTFRERTDSFASALQDFCSEDRSPRPPANQPIRRAEIEELKFDLPTDHPILEFPKKRTFPTLFIPDPQTRLNFPTVASLAKCPPPPSPN
jgi:hypothetical protein